MHDFEKFVSMLIETRAAVSKFHSVANILFVWDWKVAIIVLNLKTFGYKFVFTALKL